MKRELAFINDIPGFSGLSNFTLEINEEFQPFASLQSVDKEEVGFILADPFAFFPQFQLDLTVSIIENLEIRSQEDVQLWGIVTYRNTFAESTMNLKAPIVVNVRTSKAIQFIINDGPHSVREPLVRAVKSGEEQGGVEHARVNSQEG